MSDFVRSGQFTRSTDFSPTRDAVQPRFHMREVQDEVASASAGRPIFRSEEMVQFLIPGSPNQPVFRVTDEHKERWPKQYAAFRAGNEMAIDGTPLEQWPVLTRAMVLELKALEIHTVEQCASLADNALQRIGRGGYTIRDRAKAYLDDAERVAGNERLTHENNELKARIADLERQLTEVRPMMDSLFNQVQDLQNRPHPVATYIPGMHDPMEMAKAGLPEAPVAASALDGMRRGPGRPRKEAA
jgi:cell division protein FtsB